jgi:hypothetical protein
MRSLIELQDYYFFMKNWKCVYSLISLQCGCLNKFLGNLNCLFPHKYIRVFIIVRKNKFTILNNHAKFREVTFSGMKTITTLFKFNSNSIGSNLSSWTQSSVFLNELTDSTFNQLWCEVRTILYCFPDWLKNRNLLGLVWKLLKFYFSF